MTPEERVERAKKAGNAPRVAYGRGKRILKTQLLEMISDRLRNPDLSIHDFNALAGKYMKLAKLDGSERKHAKKTGPEAPDRKGLDEVTRMVLAEEKKAKEKVI